MRAVLLGNAGISSSCIGLGCMGMSEFYGDRNDAESMRVLERALELGVTMFDTSNIYGRGHNEELVGQFIKGRREKILLSSKFGVVRDPAGPNNSTYDRGVNNRPEYMRQCLDESLTRLGTDVIDLYYIHRMDPDVPVEESVGAMAEMITAGKIRAIGLSEVPPPILRRACAVHPIAALQTEYSLWTREPEQSVLPTCRELGITFVAFSPLGRGFLTGALTDRSKMAADDFRLTTPRYYAENFDRNVALLEKIKALAEHHRCTLGQIAIAWLLAQGNDIIPIPGTKRIKYLEENVGAAAITLDTEALAALNTLAPPGAFAGDRYDAAYGGNSKV